MRKIALGTKYLNLKSWEDLASVTMSRFEVLRKNNNQFIAEINGLKRSTSGLWLAVATLGYLVYRDEKRISALETKIGTLEYNASFEKEVEKYTEED